MNFFENTGPGVFGQTLYLDVPGSIAGGNYFLPASELPGPGQTTQLALLTAGNPMGTGCGTGPPYAPCSEESDGIHVRAVVGPAFLNVTDPACPGTDTCFAFTYTNTQISGGGGGGGGGGGNNVPEPSSVLLLGTGLAGFALRQFKKRN